MNLPLGLSVPHAGLLVPDELAGNCLLTEAQIKADGDVGAAAIYDLAEHVVRWQTTEIARAVLDMNRGQDDVRKDGIVKTHTCWDEPVWRESLTDLQVSDLLVRFHRPYHLGLAGFGAVTKLGVDCHTMAAHGPPVGPDSGQRRPLVCLGNGAGQSCPRSWIEALRDCFVAALGDDVTINKPFAGGFITRSHGREMPWVQIELSRTDDVSVADKRAGVLRALTEWCGLELWQ
ncbi:MAG: N-formylglutamate deformylase [Neolewinella sp.]|jgi:formiminoglutamase